MKIREHESLHNYTTLHIGGPARYFIKVSSRDELKQALFFARTKKLPYFILGNGSNLLVADTGFSGVVIKNQIDFIRIIEENQDLVVEAGSGTSLAKLIKFTTAKTFSGLHHFSFIPATVGGAVFGNVHYLDWLISDYFVTGKIMNGQGQTAIKRRPFFSFSYDYSILQKNQNILVSATFKLPRGDTNDIKQDILAMAERRNKYPSVSAGCIFQNLSLVEQQKIGLPNSAAAYVIDKVLGLKGKQFGGARISLKHSAFIENTGSATAKDVFKLICLIRKQAKKRLNLDLKPEIIMLGFEKSQLKDLY
jgi:UDP-N-acetylmuramate dehydrogenase